MQVLLQHRRLLTSASRLEDLVETARLTRGEVDACREQCACELESFIEQLKDHFRVEAETTSSSQLASCDPSVLVELDRLDAEHPLLLQAFELAMECARDESRPLVDLHQAVLSAVAAFRDHEARENALFPDIF